MISDLKITTLEQRTIKLERYLKLSVSIWALTIIILFTSAWTWKQYTGEVVENFRARQITIVDEKGVERIYIAASVPNPKVNGKEIARKGSQAGIILNNAKGNEVGGWGVFEDGRQNFCLDYEDGVGEALCLTQGGDRAGMLIKDREKQSFTMLLGSIGYDEAAPKLFLNDVSGKPRVKLHAKENEATLQLFDKNGQATFSASESKQSK